jgi:hypothetical protein
MPCRMYRQNPRCADNLVCHLAMLEGIKGGDATTWLEPVTDEQYAIANNQS